MSQDLLLRELHNGGALDALVFKGGTALRKLYAGQQGRFSLDLDFSLAYPADPDAVLLDLVAAIDSSQLGPFSYGVTERRGKWSVTVTSSFNEGDNPLSSKLDVSPPVWLDPAPRGWIPMPVHATYGSPPLPLLRVVRMEAVLKIWVDANGLTSTAARWKPGHEPHAFDPESWLRVRKAREFDIADLGALAVPVPTEAQLATTVSARYAFLAELDDEERQLAAAREQDRDLALRLLTELPGRRLARIGLR